MESIGIPFELFGEYLISSGLIANENLYWVSFHGVYDFAYFLKYSTNLALPENELNFFDLLELYFPNYYDIRYLVRFNDEFRGSLSKLGQELNISRIGTTHQAGSDSLITSEIFFRLRKGYLTDENMRIDRNILFGIGLGVEDNDPINSYNTFYNQTPISQNFTVNTSNANNSSSANNPNSNFSSGYEYNGYYNPNMMNMQYNNYMRNNHGYYHHSMNNGFNSYGNYNPLNMGVGGYQVNNGNNNFQEENVKKKISENIIKNHNQNQNLED